MRSLRVAPMRRRAARWRPGAVWGYHRPMGGWWGAPWLSVVLGGTVTTGAAWAQAVEAAENMSEARALFMAGRVAFEEGRYEAALKHFEASYEQSKRPASLYNIARCHNRMRRDEEA